MQLQTSQTAVDRLRACKDAPELLLGVLWDRSVTLLGCAPCESGSADALADMLPHGIDILGACGGAAAAQPRLTADASGDQPTYSLDGQAAQPRMVTVVQEDSSLQVPGCTLFRCHVEVELQVVGAAAAAAPSAKVLAAAFDQLEAELLPERGLAFVTDAGPAGAPAQLLRASSSGSVADAFSSAPGVVSVRPVVCTSTGDGSAAAAGGPPPTAPVYEFVPAGGAGGTPSASVPLLLDVLAYVPNTAPVGGSSGGGSAAARLEAALRAQLGAMRRQLAAQPALAPLRALHFAPRGLGHHITMVVPLLGEGEEACDAQLLARRQQAHKLLGLPTHAPMLRFANALLLGQGAGEGDASGRGGRLRDVHATLSAPAIGGAVSLVDGSYDYHHYMQDRFNDSGWGCAYRSLQTICSWFRAQGYTCKPPPSHRQIQDILVRLGDKPPTFAGSCQWIGAIELSYILDDYLGVTSKVVTVNKGSDIPSHARQLAAHFESQGTPIMIGGGVLAYTLLGVRFNEATGEAAFLILDPHYTGGEDLRKVHAGGWVGWKQPGDQAAAGGPLFVNDTFYNFLCPQRPSTV